MCMHACIFVLLEPYSLSFFCSLEYFSMYVLVRMYVSMLVMASEQEQVYFEVK